MAEKRARYISNFLMLLLIAVIVIPFMASCGKSSDGTVNTYNSQLVVANLSQDVGPVDLYVNNNIQNGTSPYRYPLIGSYFYLNTIGYQMQIRSNGGTKSTLLTTDSVPNRNAKYTLFITGIVADGPLKSIFVVDTSTLPAVGRGKVRFINASPRSSPFDIYANTTLAFKNIKLDSCTKFIELPVGDYNFQIYNTGDASTILNSFKQTISDGKLYTIYTYGIVGRTDSAAFNSGIITNK
jgi:Domain of unknown function (DUF4397)